MLVLSEKIEKYVNNRASKHEDKQMAIGGSYFLSTILEYNVKGS